MRKMKDSGIAWIGDIPENWECEPLKSVLNDRKEMNNPIKTNFILSLTNDRGVIPYTDKGDVGNKSKEDLTGYKLAYPNDIVLNSMNVIIGSVNLSKYFGAVSPVYYMLYLRNEKQDIRFYNYIFQTKVFQNNLKGYGNGIMEIRMRIQMSKLNTIYLAYPNNEDQKKIADYLDLKCGKVDELVGLQENMIKELKDYKQSVITEAVTKGLNKSAPMKPSGIDWIGEIPESWEVNRMRYLAIMQNGINISRESFGFGYPFVSYGDVYRNSLLPFEVVGLVNSAIADRENYSVKKGDVFFTRTSETIAEIALSSTCTKTIENAVFAGFLIRARLISNKINIDYGKYYFRSSHLRKYFVEAMNIITRASLSQELLKDLMVLIPPQQEQQEIADYLDKKCEQIDKLIAIKQQKIQELKDYKKSLIYEHVTGKKEVM